MTDTNSKAQVTEEAIRKAGKAVIDHMADNGLTYEAVAQELTDCLMRIVDPDFIAALAAQEKPEPGVAVAWQVKDFADGWVTTANYSMVEDLQRQGHAVRPLYLHPTLVSTQTRVGEPGLSEMRVIDPDQWEPCSPSYLNRGGDCASAPRVWNADEKNHWHPKLAAAPSPDLPEGEVARKFNLGDHVHKVKGASWTGHVVGFYSTELTPVGYAVESSREKGSVQIYPEAALEFSTSPSPIDKGEVK